MGGTELVRKIVYSLLKKKKKKSMPSIFIKNRTLKFQPLLQWLFIESGVSPIENKERTNWKYFCEIWMFSNPRLHTKLPSSVTRYILPLQWWKVKDKGGDAFRWPGFSPPFLWRHPAGVQRLEFMFSWSLLSPVSADLLNKRSPLLSF